jgi:hypothetical protein
LKLTVILGIQSFREALTFSLRADYRLLSRKPNSQLGVN